MQLYSQERLSPSPFSHTEIPLQSLNAGTTLFHEADPAHRLIILVKGRVHLSTQSPEGRASLIVLRAPSIFGEEALESSLTGETLAYSSTSETRLDSKIMSFERHQIQKAILRDPELGQTIGELLVDRSRRKNLLLARRKLPASARVAFELLDEPLDESGLTIPISQYEFADRAGAIRESVCQAISFWRKKEYIRVMKGGRYAIDKRRPLGIISRGWVVTSDRYPADSSQLASDR